MSNNENNVELLRREVEWYKEQYDKSIESMEILNDRIQYYENMINKLAGILLAGNIKNKGGSN